MAGREEQARADRARLDTFWLKDEGLSDWGNLPAPEVMAQEIVDDLEAALEQFRLIAGDLGVEPNPTTSLPCSLNTGD